MRDKKGETLSRLRGPLSTGKAVPNRPSYLKTCRTTKNRCRTNHLSRTMKNCLRCISTSMKSCRQWRMHCLCRIATNRPLCPRTWCHSRANRLCHGHSRLRHMDFHGCRRRQSWARHRYLQRVGYRKDCQKQKKKLPYTLPTYSYDFVPNQPVMQRCRDRVVSPLSTLSVSPPFGALAYK